MSSPDNSLPSELRPRSGDALLLIDVQSDFLPGMAKRRSARCNVWAQGLSERP